jgi:hypothetical protein
LGEEIFYGVELLFREPVGTIKRYKKKNGKIKNFSEVKMASAIDSLPGCGRTNYDFCKISLILLFFLIPLLNKKQAEKYPSLRAKRGNTSYGEVK